MNTTVWLIRYTDARGQQRAVAQLHNCVADYRANVDPRATVQAMDVAALADAAQAAADFSFEAALNKHAGNTAATLHDHCAIKLALRQALGHATPAPDDGIQRGNADLVPAQHATLGTPA